MEEDIGIFSGMRLKLKHRQNSTLYSTELERRDLIARVLLKKYLQSSGLYMLFLILDMVNYVLMLKSRKIIFGWRHVTCPHCFVFIRFGTNAWTNFMNGTSLNTRQIESLIMPRDGFKMDRNNRPSILFKILVLSAVSSLSKKENQRILSVPSLQSLSTRQHTSHFYNLLISMFSQRPM